MSLNNKHFNISPVVDFYWFWISESKKSASATVTVWTQSYWPTHMKHNLWEIYHGHVIHLWGILVLMLNMILAGMVWITIMFYTALIFWETCVKPIVENQVPQWLKKKLCGTGNSWKLTQLSGMDTWLLRRMEKVKQQRRGDWHYPYKWWPKEKSSLSYLTPQWPKGQRTTFQSL